MKNDGVKKKKMPTIAQLEALLKSEEDVPLTIMPNGEVRRLKGKALKLAQQEKLKPITYKEDLGGEYGVAA